MRSSSDRKTGVHQRGIHPGRGDHPRPHVEDLHGDDRSRSPGRHDDRMGGGVVREDVIPSEAAAAAEAEGQSHRQILDCLVVLAVEVANFHNPVDLQSEAPRYSALVDSRGCRR